MKIKTIMKVVLGFSALVATGATMAATSTTASQTMNATATVAAECAFKVGSDFAIGNLTMIDVAQTSMQSAAANHVDSSLDLICTNGTQNATITFASTNSGALKNGSSTINYTLYKGTGGTGTAITWGTPADIVTDLGLAADGTKKTVALTVNVTAADKAGALTGSYSDTITVTMTYDL